MKEETPGLSIGDVAKKLGEMWNKTSAEEKQPYEKKAAKLKEKYEKVVFFVLFFCCFLLVNKISLSQSFWDSLEYN